MDWLRLGLLFVAGSAGLVAMTAGNALSRAGRDGDEALFWLGFLMVVAAGATAVVARGPTRLERGLVVVGVGLLLYLSKVLHDPFLFVFSDEFVHVRNAEEILAAGGLFPDNSILPVTTVYPGLGSVTAGLAQLSGMSVFAAGIAIIGAGRAVLMLALFLAFERLTGSSRVAALGVLIYAGNPNFLFWSGQYSYQSLALPLAALAVLAVVLRRDGEGRERRAVLFVVFAMALGAAAITHHLTSFAVAAMLIGVSLIAHVRGRHPEAAWGYAVFALVVGISLLQVPVTEAYLIEIASSTWEGVAGVFGGDSGTRTLFVSDTGEGAPLIERGVAALAVIVIVALLPAGLRRIGRESSPSILVGLGIVAVAYIVFLPLRLIPSAWETANRASDFLYVGIGITVALALTRLWWPRTSAGLRVAAAGAVCVIAVGGVIAGWSPQVRLSQPLIATVNGHRIEPQGFAAARWSMTLGPNRRIVADGSDARLLLTRGRQLPFAPPDGRARAVLEPDDIEAVRPTLRAEEIAYVVVDRRRSSNDNLTGYFFAPAGQPRVEEFIEPDRRDVFEVAGADRLFDSGDVVVYDVRGLAP